nr:PREDICTED: E3 ubiquitin-protein ligase sina-like [Bemisia tabaci]
MLDKLKQWGLRLVKGDAEIEGVIAAELVCMRHDPREIPRPFRNMRFFCSQNNNTVFLPDHSIREDSENGGGVVPCCMNCKELVENITDCSICLEPFLKSGISSCQKCGNLTCWSCAQRLFTCPFCRVEMGFSWQRNVALEKLVNKLELPCRNAKWGCKLRMVKSLRSSHENKCKFMPVYCPLKQYCSWQGDINSLSQHLAEVHSLTLLAGNRITVEISSFRAKMKQSERRSQKYIVLLNCFSMFFFCKLSLYRKKLTVVFMQVTDMNAIMYSNSANQKFSAWLEVSSSFRTIKGVMPISSVNKNNKELQLSCESLLSPWKQTEDRVRIGIVVHPSQ